LINFHYNVLFTSVNYIIGLMH